MAAGTLVKGATFTLPTGMRRTAADQWTVEGFTIQYRGGALRHGLLRSIGYCGHRAAVPDEATKTAVFYDQRATAIATCPAGEVVVGGGFATNSSRTGVSIGVLERVTAAKWRVSVNNRPYSGSASTVTAIAYCGAGPPPKLVSKTIRLTLNKPATAHVSCPAGTRLLFGGVDARPIDRGGPWGAIPLALAAAGNNTWNVSSVDDRGLTSGITALAYCR